MKEDSEEARLMGDKTTMSSAMSYTDGPKPEMTDAAASPLPCSPPDYEKAIMDEPYWHGEHMGRKGSSGGSEKSQDSELLNELINYSGTTLMTQFHADALKQVGYGKFQMMVILVAGLCFSTQIAQAYSIFFAFPSVNLEFCMDQQQKDLLIAIHFMGTAVGAMQTGAIAEINGRKKTLLTLLMCMTLFSVVSAFMPTFGPFAMTRFIAAACSGGIFPIGASYVGEMCAGSVRGRSVAMVVGIGLIGGTISAATSIIMLPTSPEALLLEHRNHYSSWHRYLLIMTLSSILPIFGLLSLPESPRWLLDVGREVEALEIYKRIYSENRVSGRYTLTELELPGMRSERHTAPKSVLTAMANNAFQFFDSFGSVLRPPYKKTTMLLMLIWFVTLFILFGLTVYILRYGHSLEEHLFNAKATMNFNQTFENITLTSSFVNHNFSICQFRNVTFDKMVLSYVTFQNCTLLDTNFHGVKTSNTTFLSSVLNHVNFIDTDLTESNFVKCIKKDINFNQMLGVCDLEFNFNLFNKVDYHAIVACAFPSVVAITWAGTSVNRLGRVRVAAFCFTLATMLCCMIGFICVGEPIYWVLGVVQASILAGLTALTVFTIEYYCTYLRCTALGVTVCFGLFGAGLGGRVYNQLPISDTHMAAVLSIAGLSFPSVLTTFLRETSQLL